MATGESSNVIGFRGVLRVALRGLTRRMGGSLGGLIVPFIICKSLFLLSSEWWLALCTSYSSNVVIGSRFEGGSDDLGSSNQPPRHETPCVYCIKTHRITSANVAS